MQGTYDPFQQHCCNNGLSDGIAFLSFLCSLGLLYIAFQARHDWQKKVKCEKLEETKKELVYSIIDLVNTLKIHCYEDPSVSSKSEEDFDIYKKFDKNENNIVAHERLRIDIEITNKFRALNKNIELFEFYANHKNVLLMGNLRSFRDKLHTFAQSVNMLIMYKFSAYYLNENNEYLHRKFSESLINIQSKLKTIEEAEKTLLQELKQID